MLNLKSLIEERKKRWAYEILPGLLWLGSGEHASNLEAMQFCSIRRVLNVADDVENYHDEETTGIKYENLSVSDFGQDKGISRVFPKAFAFLASASSNNLPVLVHCAAGANRSATIVLAWLMYSKNMTLLESWNHVKGIKPGVCPMLDNRRQLLAYERELYNGVSSFANDEEFLTLKNCKHDHSRHINSTLQEQISPSHSSSSPPPSSNGVFNSQKEQGVSTALHVFPRVTDASLDGKRARELALSILAPIQQHEHELVVVPLTGGEVSTTFLVTKVDNSSSTGKSSSVVVRMHPDPTTYKSTSLHHTRLASLGLPVPQVLSEGSGFIVLSYLPGRDLRHVLPSMSIDAMSSLAGRIAAIQHCVVDAIPPNKAGRFGWVGMEEPGLFATWREAVSIAPGSAPPGIDLYLDSVTPRCFLDDITGKNVMVTEQGELVGLVDFDHVCFGDVLHWLGLTAAGILVDCDDRELWYAEELVRLYGVTSDQYKVVWFYAARIAKGFLDDFGLLQSQVWRDRVSKRIARWLAEAGGSLV